MAGLISGGETRETLAVEITAGAARVATGTFCATKCGTWGLGIFLQTADNR